MLAPGAIVLGTIILIVIGIVVVAAGIWWFVWVMMEIENPRGGDRAAFFAKHERKRDRR